MSPHCLAFVLFSVWSIPLCEVRECGEDSPRGESVPLPQQTSQQMFSAVQEALLSGDGGVFRPSLSSQVYLSLRGGVNGYYSANQAAYLLDQFLKAHRITSLKFTTYGGSETSPYATGSIYLTQKGSRERGQVYVSLSLSGGRWVISQISLY